MALNQEYMESVTYPNCLSCELRPNRVFCDLPSDALQSFDQIKSTSVYPRGATLFGEGRPAKGIFVLCDGRAKLSVSGENGKRLMLRVAGPGEVLGLSSALSGTPYEITAEAVDASQVVFVKRKDLLKFLRDHKEACLQVVHLLSGDLHSAYDRVRSIGLSRTRRTRVPAAVRGKA